MIRDLLQGIYTHYTLEDVETLVERQNKKTEVVDKRAELHIYGPFYHRVQQDDIMSLKVYIHLTFRSDRNVYTWGDLAQKYVDRANTPLRIDDFCLVLQDVRVIYRGGLDFLEFCTVEVAYQYNTGDTYIDQD